ncbi:hypothetical protein [Paraburkholderia sp. CI3]|uniref:hypothetical protein n=1 Tax=Paraburkholderia sp. CI3 TaxID=2991060 RepID=UPI003D2352CF
MTNLLFDHAETPIDTIRTTTDAANACKLPEYDRAHSLFETRNLSFRAMVVSKGRDSGFG